MDYLFLCQIKVRNQKFHWGLCQKVCKDMIFVHNSIQTFQFQNGYIVVVPCAIFRQLAFV